MAKKTKRKAKQDLFISVVMVTAHGRGPIVDDIISISSILDSEYTNYEIIIIDNGLLEEESLRVSSLLDTYPCLRIIKLSRFSSHEVAVFAGIEQAIGDYVCTFTPSADPVDAITKIIELNRRDDVVQGVSSTPLRGVLGSRLGRKLFYWYNRKYVGVDIPIDGTYFASYSRAAVNALLASRRSHRYIRHLVRLIGYKPVNFIYQPLQESARRHTVKNGVIEALEITTSYSTHPLRFVTWLGFIAGVINIIYAVYVVIINFTNDSIAAGWTTTSLQLSGMFFILFCIMVILAEYIGRILIESQHEPRYYVVSEQSSTVAIANQKRRNIEK